MMALLRLPPSGPPPPPHALSPRARAVTVRRPAVSGQAAAAWGEAAAGRRKVGRVLDRGGGCLAAAVRDLGRDQVTDLDRADAGHLAGHPRGGPGRPGSSSGRSSSESSSGWWSASGHLASSSPIEPEDSGDIGCSPPRDNRGHRQPGCLARGCAAVTVLARGDDPPGPPRVPSARASRPAVAAGTAPPESRPRAAIGSGRQAGRRGWHGRVTAPQPTLS